VKFGMNIDNTVTCEFCIKYCFKSTNTSTNTAAVRIIYVMYDKFRRKQYKCILSYRHAYYINNLLVKFI
jgi:hypothetical protein